MAGALQSTLQMAIESVELGEGALRVLGAYYLRRSSERGKAETPLDLFARIARKISEGELIREGPTEAEYYEGVFLSLMTSPLDVPPDLFEVLKTASSAVRKGCQVALKLKTEGEIAGLHHLAGSVAGMLEGFITRPSSVSISLDLGSFPAELSSLPVLQGAQPPVQPSPDRLCPDFRPVSERSQARETHRADNRRGNIQKGSGRNPPRGAPEHEPRSS